MNDEYLSLMKPWHGAEDIAPAPTSDPAKGLLGDTTMESYEAAIGAAHRAMTALLQDQLLGYIHAQTFGFFEELILDVVVALGYAGRRRDLARKIGRSGDGGVDGVIELDELGLDVIYLQAKRLKPGNSVSAPAVRDFIGSLETKRATKGILVTTGSVTAAARAATEHVSKRVVLIDGPRLAELMIRHLIGIRVKESFQFKEIDPGYFEERMARSNSRAG